HARFAWARPQCQPLAQLGRLQGRQGGACRCQPRRAVSADPGGRRQVDLVLHIPARDTVTRTRSSPMETEKPKDTILATTADAIRLAKTLMRTARYGAIATLDPETGWPTATRVGVSTDFDGAPIVLISRLAAHTKA